MFYPTIAELQKLYHCATELVIGNYVANHQAMFCFRINTHRPRIIYSNNQEYHGIPVMVNHSNFNCLGQTVD